MILMIDNYDSFTFNLVQALEAAGAEVRVLRNDAIDRAGIEALAADPAANLRGIVVSPGPGDPDSAGVSMDAIRVGVERQIPTLGVCLGMQSMAQAFGATIVRAPTLVHGEASSIRHDGNGLLAGIPSPFMAARYHSLSVAPATLPGEFVVTARTEEDGVVMGIRHLHSPVEGVQFHPESVLTPQGPHLLANFLRLAGEGEGTLLDRVSGTFALSGLDGDRAVSQPGAATSVGEPGAATSAGGAATSAGGAATSAGGAATSAGGAATSAGDPRATSESVAAVAGRVEAVR